MRRTLSMLGGIVVAIALSQFPEYAQQYTQRLGGAVDELRILTEEFDQAARQSGLTRDDAIGRFATTGDRFIEGRGTSMEQTFERYQMLSATLAEIQGASGWERFTLLPRYLDSEIGARTLDSFRPAVPATMEGVVYAGAGFLGGYLLTSGLLRFLLLPFRRRRAYREEVAPIPEARKIAVLQPRPVDPEPRMRADEPYFAPPPPVVDLEPAPAKVTPRPEPAPVVAPPPPEPVERRKPPERVEAAGRMAELLGEPLPPQKPVWVEAPAPATRPAPAAEPRPEPVAAARARPSAGTFVHPAVEAARRRAAVQAATRDIKKSLYPG